MPRIATPVLTAALAAVLLAGCGSSANSSSASSAGTAASNSGPSLAPTTGGPGGGAPAVDSPTDLKTAPVIHPGTPPAPTALVMTDLVVGTGQQATAANTVSVQYVGANFTDGVVFDSSWKGGQPIDFPLNGVIPGFSQGIAGMKVGGRRELVIPPSLGYGAQGSPPAVAGNETLVFVIDLVGLK